MVGSRPPPQRPFLRRTRMKFRSAQINSNTSVPGNLDKVRTFTHEAAGAGARFIVFPEATMSAFGPGLRAMAQEHADSWRSALKGLAAEAGITVIVGEFGAAADKVINLLAVYTPDGDRRDYAKIHLYDAFGFTESDTVEPGEEPVVMSSDGEDLGLALCYDMRFPKLCAELIRRGGWRAVVAAAWGAEPRMGEQWEIRSRVRALVSN